MFQNRLFHFDFIISVKKLNIYNSLSWSNLPGRWTQVSYKNITSENIIQTSRTNFHTPLKREAIYNGSAFIVT